jgi:hypothetical protein
LGDDSQEANGHEYDKQKSELDGIDAVNHGESPVVVVDWEKTTECVL